MGQLFTRPRGVAEVLPLLKPGGHLLAFGGPRTFHRLTVAIEDSGFEIRDCLSWLYGSGMPHGLNLAGGYSTTLKPSWEPVVMARKPLEGTVADNVATWGCGALNIEGGRIGDTGGTRGTNFHPGIDSKNCYGTGLNGNKQPVALGKGRWPANTIVDETTATALGPHSRFFYCTKASRAERNHGLEGMEKKPNSTYGDFRGTPEHSPKDKERNAHENNHPCLKPLKLTAYLATLLLPPPRETPRRLLCPFSGSGSEMIGGILAGWEEVVGIEREEQYIQIARKRIDGQ